MANTAFGLTLPAMQSILRQMAAAQKLAAEAKRALDHLPSGAEDDLLRALAEWEEAVNSWGKK